MRSDIQIKLERPRVELLLERYQDRIGEDYLGYRNHVYRTITYAMHFLDCLLYTSPSPRDRQKSRMPSSA